MVEDNIRSITDEFFKKSVTRLELPSLAYGVTYQGKLIASGAVGDSDPFLKTPATAETIYPIASMTKSFAGVALLILRDKGLLNLSDSVASYIPELSSNQRWNETTISDLAFMRSGLPEDNPWGDRQLECTDAEFSGIYDRGAKGDFVFFTPRDISASYSNLSYMMLGRIISKVSGQHALSFISENILEKLEMSSTLWSAENSSLKFAVGSTKENISIVPSTSKGDGAVFGGLLSNVPDLSTWINFLISKNNSKYDAILKETSRIELRLGGRMIENLKNPFAILSYGFGIGGYYLPDSNFIRFGHSGGLPGFGSRMDFISEHQFGVIALSNITYAPMASLCNEFLQIIIKELPSPKYPNRELVENYFRSLVSLIQLWDEKLAEEIFASNFFLDNSREEIIQRFKLLHGRIEDRSFHLESENALAGHILLDQQKILRFSLAPAELGRIQSIEFTEIT